MYKNLTLNSAQMDLNQNQPIVVSVDVSNTGNVSGKEVVQLYIRDKQTTIERPDKELKGFEKVVLQPGQTKTVTFTVDKRAISAYDDTLKSWVSKAGLFQVLVGSSSRDIRQQGEFRTIRNDTRAK